MTDKAGFTPGPWRVNSMEFTAKRPQEVTFGVQAVGMAMDEANANLIAAAPDLYDALLGLSSAALILDFKSEASMATLGRMIPIASAALAKARGES